MDLPSDLVAGESDVPEDNFDTLAGDDDPTPPQDNLTGRKDDIVSSDLEQTTWRNLRGGPQNHSDDSGTPDAAARRFGDYLIERELARGGMGVVYRARQQSLNRTVALKMIRSGELAGEDEVRRFRVEAEAAAALDHPAIVPIYDVGEIDGQHYYSMGFVDGQSLSDVLALGPLPPSDAAMLVAMVADAMHYAHTKGVIHRDLKPGNILLIDHASDSRSSADRSSSRSHSSPSHRHVGGDSAFQWQPRVTDFGLAKQTQSDSELTSTGQVLGTPSYMPPEQARGDMDIGPAADVYALGAVLYAALVGRPPFQAARALDTIKQVIEQDPVAPSRFNGAIRRDLDNICLKCLEKSPARRYESAAELASDLYAFLEGRPVQARPIGNVERFWRWCRRKPMAATAVFAAGTAILTMFVLALVSSRLRLAEEKSRRLEQEGELTRERSQRLENESELRRQQLLAAEQRAKADQRLAATQEYFAIVSRVRERNAFAKLGWAFEGQEDIRRAGALNVEHPNLVELRSTAARCIAGVDAKVLVETPMPGGYRSHRIAVDPIHKRYAVATMKNRFQLYVCVCDSSGEKTHELRVLPRSVLAFDGIWHAAFLDHGDTLAIVTRTGYLHRWNLTQTSPEPTSVAVPFEANENVVFDEPRNRALVCDSNNHLHLWPDFDATETKLLKKGCDRVWDVSPDGTLLAMRSEGKLQVLNVDTAEVAYSHPTSLLARFDESGRLAVSRNSHLELLDARTGQLLQTLRDPLTERVHEGVLRNIHASPDGALLATGGSDQRVKIWDVASGDLLLSIFLGGEDEIYPMFLGNDLLATTGDKRGVLYQLNGRKQAAAIAIHRPLQSFCLSSSPQRIVTGGADSEGALISLWNAAGERRQKNWHLGRSFFPPRVSVERAGKAVAVASVDARRIWAWELPADDSKSDEMVTIKCEPAACAIVNKEVWTIEESDQLTCRRLADLEEVSRWSNKFAARLYGNGSIASLAAVDQFVAAVTKTGHLVLFRASDQSEFLSKPIRLGATVVAIDPDSTWVAYGTADGEVAAVPLPNKAAPAVGSERLNEAAGNEAAGNEAAGNEAGGNEAAGNEAGGNVANASRPEELACNSPHLDFVTSVALSPDNQLLASASRDRTIRIWSRTESALELVLKFELPRVPQQVQFTPEGDLIALLQKECGLRVWRIAALRERLKQLQLDW